MTQETMGIIKLCISISAVAVAIATYICAFIIPKRIMANQLFADLVAEYRTPEMGGAILALFHFYNKCTKKNASLNSEYKKLYKKQIKKPLKACKKINFASTLHFQRRLVAQYYADMADLYTQNTCYISLRKKIKNWLTSNELQLLKIILSLMQPASNVFIQVGNVPEPPDIEIQLMYKSISSLYMEVSEHIRKS